MPETSLSVAKARTVAIRRVAQPGNFINMLLRDGLVAPPLWVGKGSEYLPEDVDWAAVCAVAYRCRIAPVMYQCLRAASVPVPAEVMSWFREQYHGTIARNSVLLNDLRDLLGWLSDAPVPSIVIKGPVLAHFGVGVARVSSDLDVLIRPSDLPRADAVLRHHGYTAWLRPAHDYHRRYTRPAASGTSLVEIHFDISDRLRHYQADIAGIWNRSTMAPISGLLMRIPDLTDQLLLTIMQLPHHHWPIRLMVDLWQVVMRCGNEINWQSLLDRAKHWNMSVLTRSALHVLEGIYGVRLPPTVTTIASPSGYFERVQWRVAQCAIAEQLEHPFRSRAIWVVPYFMVDQTTAVPAILLGRLFGAGGAPAESALATAARRNGATVSALPAIVKILLASIAQTPSHAGRRR